MIRRRSAPERRETIDKMSNSKGWLVSNDDGSTSRGIVMHDTFFGGDSMVPSMALAGVSGQ